MVFSLITVRSKSDHPQPIKPGLGAEEGLGPMMGNEIDLTIEILISSLTSRIDMNRPHPKKCLRKSGEKGKSHKVTNNLRTSVTILLFEHLSIRLTYVKYLP